MSDYLKISRVLWLASVFATLLAAARADAQRPRFPDFFDSRPAGGFVQQAVPAISQGVPAAQLPSLTVPSFSNGQPGIVGAPPTVLPAQPQFGQPPVLIPGGQPSNFSGGLPNFQPPSLDPFSIPNQSFPGFPGGGGGTPNYQIYPPANNQPLVGPNSAPPPVRTVPNYQPPNINRNFPGGNANGGLGANYYNSDTGRSGLTAWPQRAWSSFQNDFLPRLLERPRARHTYLAGNNGNELDINDVEVATTLNWVNFAGSGQPLLFSPGFIFHFWDGPESVPGFDLPGQAYSAYLSFDHTTDTQRNFGLENNFTVGVYSDFDHLSSDSLRFTGKLLGWRRINSYSVAKLGVEYLDRVDVKLLPAFGIYSSPNPDMKLDLYFPRTKLSHRVPNFNDFEVWSYVGGEYGGGSWTIERADGSDDQVDINDVRAFIGLEWIGPRRVTGFVEFGYAFERELVYKSDSINGLDLQDTVMVRSGLAF